MITGLRALHYPGQVHVADLPRASGPSLTGRYWEPISGTYDASTDRTTILFRLIPRED
jgi:hypothetical protein